MEPNCPAQRDSPVNEINLHLFAFIFAHSTLIAWGKNFKVDNFANQSIIHYPAIALQYFSHICEPE
jgi:hypothetical protein